MRAKILIALALSLWSASLVADDLSAQFARPPASARPWVYWFWNNGNVTKAGITADLEAMKRTGIGGVIIMDVVERFAPPPGTADFMGEEWQELFRFAVSEAHRLGLEINMTNGPGWCGSSGPWITPEFSMQMLVTTNLTLEGPANFSAVLPQPATAKQGHDGFNSTVKYDDFYRDIAVLAIPETPGGSVSPAAVVNLTAKLDATGKLNWDVPAGKWLVQRIGYTITGSSTRPPVKGGNGLECDKLSQAAMDLHFTNMMGKLIGEVGPLAGTTLVATHIDSWEVGSQNWTPKFREEFIRLRGYDPTPYLPDVPGINQAATDSHLVIGTPETASRFRWDFEQTISDLLAENYVGRLAELAHQHGLRLTLEGYELPFGDEATYTQRADEPMSEFWATGAEGLNQAKARQMASVAHIMGYRIVGAEAFTSGDSEQWKMHPATVKALGDYEFSQGINRFVIHRYAHQPYLDRFPGATMGPWGLHYERTQTWWEMSSAWHEYLSRCQWMLRQGRFVADLCYLRPELPNQTYFTPAPAIPAGYKYDECSAEALIARMSVKDGRLVLPDGMSYRMLVLPPSTVMTPKLAQKIKQLVESGATVLGPRPTASPSLADFPQCDDTVKQIAAEVWGDCDGKTVTTHALGKGQIIWGQPLKDVLEQLQTPADFTSNVKLNWIHRQVDGSEIYFVANGTDAAVEAQCDFRVKGLRPELWNPQTGEMSPLAAYEETATGISLPLRLEASGSVFVVFRPHDKVLDPIVQFTRDGQPVVPASEPPVIKLQQATYGVPGDAVRTRDVLNKVQAMVDRGESDFQVSELAQGDDPALGTVKTLTLKYTADDRPFTISGQDPDQISLDPSLVLTTGAEGTQGLTGEYFTTANLEGAPAVVRTDAKINFAWNSGSPAPGIPANNWSARWTGTLTALKSGEYTFCLYADDGCRLLIDDHPIIDHWDLDTGKEAHTGKIHLIAGQSYHFRVEYFQGGGDDNIQLSWLVPAGPRPAEVHCDVAGRLKVVASQPGTYELTGTSGKTWHAEIKNVPAPQELTGPWQVSFPPKWGAPEKITLDPLISLSDSTNAGVKYFSGTATYTKTFEWTPAANYGNDTSETWLDLGDVQVMARVKLNGHDLGILWKPPFRVDVTGALRSGRNVLEVRVADLWPNRMIGDAALPVAQRFTWSSYEPFTPDSPLPKSGLLGPVTLHSLKSFILP